jgi:hypothetical protein
MWLLLKSTSSSFGIAAVVQVLQHCTARSMLHGASDLTFKTGFRDRLQESTEKLSVKDSTVPTMPLSQPMRPSARTVLFE